MMESTDSEAVLGFARQALRMASATLPHLTGLAHRVRLTIDDRFPVAAITASGKLLVNSQQFATMSLPEATFVLAHELLHLALDTHNRGHGADRETVNFAHDYIINDILREELQMSPPLGGLTWNGARHQSLEQMVLWMESSEVVDELSGWNPPIRRKAVQSKGSLAKALLDAGIETRTDRCRDLDQTPVDAPPVDAPPVDAPQHLDVVSAELEATLYPGETISPNDLLEIRREGTVAASLGVLRARTRGARTAGTDEYGATSLLQAVRGCYQTPWEVAMQRWLEAVAPGQRTYHRASRRGADRTDVVLPGRQRDGWTLHIVLDTSGSMEKDLPAILGAITDFCESAGVIDVHIIQTDFSVNVDEFVAVDELRNYRVAGFGGSDMSPGMDRLSEDPEVSAAIVLTDGYIDYPEDEPTYRVLWVVTEGDLFAPPYGEVIWLTV